jgi:hypothetical protein
MHTGLTEMSSDKPDPDEGTLIWNAPSGTEEGINFMPYQKRKHERENQVDSRSTPVSRPAANFEVGSATYRRDSTSRIDSTSDDSVRTEVFHTGKLWTLIAVSQHGLRAHHSIAELERGIILLKRCTKQSTAQEAIEEKRVSTSAI